MSKRNNYNTKQKETILDSIKKMNSEFTIKDLYYRLNQEVGLTTIYRFINHFVEEGYLEKKADNNNTITYLFLEKCDCSNHFYLKCNQCGKLIHVDCDCIKDLSFHISNHHQFEVTDRIIILGICNQCKRGEEIC